MQVFFSSFESFSFISFFENSANHLGFLDYIILFAYLVIALAIGFYYSKKASQSLNSFFLANRSLPWWWLGISMAATTFAADTPLAITSIIRDTGIWGNWLWWCWGIGWVMSSYFIAPLWRRLEVTTDAEIIVHRYDRGAGFLRTTTAIYFGVILNLVIMGWVIGAMSTILTVVTGWDNFSTAVVLMMLALVYSVSSGLWGVIITDLFQFVLALAGTIFFAVYIYQDIGIEWADILSTIRANSLSTGKLDILPNSNLFWGLIFFLVIQWWAFYQSSLNIYFAQRLGATRSPNDAQKAGILFNVINFGIRHWPWVIIAVCSLYLWPSANDVGNALAVENIQLPKNQWQQAAYPLLMLKLPAGYLGLVLLSLLAAFMSTIDTHLNWGASYIIKDLYLPFRQKRGLPIDGPEQNNKNILYSRLAMVCLFGGAILVAWLGDSVFELWILLFGLTAGLGLVYLLRWFWWRVNAYAEIAAMVAGLFGTLVFFVLEKLTFFGDTGANISFAQWINVGAANYSVFKILCITGLSVFVTLLFCYAGPAVNVGLLNSFRERVKPSLWVGRDATDKHFLEATVKKALLGLLIVYGFLFAIYFLLF